MTRRQALKLYDRWQAGYPSHGRLGRSVFRAILTLHRKRLLVWLPTATQQTNPSPWTLRRRKPCLAFFSRLP